MSFFEFPHTRTYDSDLGWLIKQVNSFDETIEALNQWIEENTPKLDDMMELYNMLLAGNLPEGVQLGIEKWCRANMPDLVKEMILSVWFGLTDDGYFVAYIPDSWADIVFNTSGLDVTIPGVDYGHLVLSFNA